MTFFMISGMICFLAIIFLVWCFRGFSQDLKQGKTIGLLVRPVTTQRAVLKQNIQRVVRMSGRREQFSNAYRPGVNPTVPITARSQARRQIVNKAVPPLSGSTRSAAG